MVFDQHIHSIYSEDGNHSICDIAERAIEAGLTGITVTDHFDLCTDPIGYPFYLANETARQMDFERAKERFGDRLTIRWGLELGNPFLMPGVAEPLLESRSFDFILGSVHYLRDGRDVYLVDYSTSEAREQALTMYFEDILTLIEQSDFDSLAHLDYPLRVMQGKMEPTVRPWAEQIDAILSALVRKDLALEVNTRGLMDWKGRQEPEDWVLRRFYELGGRLVTIGSDAHTLKAVGFGVEKATQKVQELGFEGVAVYNNRRVELYPFA